MIFFDTAYLLAIDYGSESEMLSRRTAPKKIPQLRARQLRWGRKFVIMLPSTEPGGKTTVSGSWCVMGNVRGRGNLRVISISGGSHGGPYSGVQKPVVVTKIFAEGRMVVTPEVALRLLTNRPDLYCPGFVDVDIAD